MSKVKIFGYHSAGTWVRKGTPWLKDLNRIYGRQVVKTSPHPFSHFLSPFPFRMRDMGFVEKFRADLLPLRATLVRLT